MPVQIRFPTDRFQLVADRGGVRLPEITLVPTADNRPHIKRISLRIDGPACEVVQMLQAGLRELNYPQPYLLRAASSLKPPPVALAISLPSRLELRFIVQVHYYNSDGNGTVLAAAVPSAGRDPLLQQAEAILPLFTVDVCTLRVEPPELIVLDGGEPARLRVVVDRGPQEARPVVRLNKPDAIPHPELRSALEEALRALPEKVALDANTSTWTLHRQQSPSNRAAIVHRSTVQTDEAFEIAVGLRLPEKVRQDLLRLDRRGEFAIPVRSEMPDGGFSNHVLRVRIKQVPHPGWLAIDFGTSSSTVCLHDPTLQAASGHLPAAQYDTLKDRLVAWLSMVPSDALPGVPAAEWSAYLEQVGRILGLGSLAGPNGVRRHIQESTTEQLLEALRQMETALDTSPERLALAASVKLHQIYQLALCEPPLEALFLAPVLLDANQKIPEVLSELELLDGSGEEADSARLLQVRMGTRAKQNRLASIGSAGDDHAFKMIHERFHHSPKRYLHRKRTRIIHRNGVSLPLEEMQLAKAAWGHLIELWEDFRQNDPARFHEGSMEKAVITYPVVAPPPVRQKIRKLVEELGVKIVNTSYDEAVSVIFFYLLREFGAFPEIGLEAFRARCRKLPDGKLIQNVLIFDIGGGTTDVALVRLELVDEDPWEPGEDRGAGGRYYVITPRVLGASGNMRLGGELMSLHLFRLVKVLLVDRVLTLAQEGKLMADSIKQHLEAVPEPFRTRNPSRPYDAGKNEPGALVKPIDLAEADREQKLNYQLALDFAEQVLPTRWEKPTRGGRAAEAVNRAARLQAFSALWEIIDRPPNKQGEEAGLKVTLGRRQIDGHKAADFVIKGEEVQAILEYCGHDVHVDPRLLEVRVSYDQFRNAVLPSVQEAARIASRLAAGRLEGEDQVDWVILSGKTCNLQLVQDELRKVFAEEGSRFRWNPDRITFEPSYAKLACAIGACYAEYLRAHAFAPQDAKQQLRTGGTVLIFRVQNLLNDLPCEFWATGLTAPIFTNKHSFRQLDRSAFGKVRTDPDNWLPLPEAQLNVTRKDYRDDQGTYYGSYRMETPDTWGQVPPEVRKKLRVQYQIDSRFLIRLFFCQDGKPHYAPAGGTQADVTAALLGGLPMPAGQPARSAAPQAKTAVVAGAMLPERLAFDIATNLLEAQGGEPTILFSTGTEWDRTFHLPDGSTRRGAISAQRLEAVPPSGVFTVYARAPRGPWRELCRLTPPPPVDADGGFPRLSRFALDQAGTLYLHLGEVPYWTCTHPKHLATPGCVFVDDLAFEEKDQDVGKDPFSGVH